MDTVIPLLQEATENIFFFGVMFIVTLAVVITIHELGHYMAARICGVYVEKFAFGFGREIVGFGGGRLKTRWSICLFPIGGFVKLFGDVDIRNPVIWDYDKSCERMLSNEELQVAFCTKTIWQRIFIVLAGPCMNLIFTLFIFVGVFATYGQRSSPLVVNAILFNSAAYEADIRIGDKLLEMDGRKIRRLEDIYDITWYENPPLPHKYKIIRDNQVISKTFTAKRVEYIDKKGVKKSHGQTGMVYIRAIKFEDISAIDNIVTHDQPDKARIELLRNMDKEINITVPFERGKERKRDVFSMYFPSSLNKHLNNPEHEHYDRVFLVDPEKKFYIRLSLLEAVAESIFFIQDIAVNSYKITVAALSGRNNEPILGGVGKISQYSAKSARSGFYDYLMFLAGFSLMIAIINLLPIPALDGGYLLFLMYELISGNPVSERIQSIILIIGMVFLGGIMIFANVSDFIYMLSNIDSG